MGKKKYDIVKVEFGDILVMKTVASIKEADEIAEKYILGLTSKESKTISYYIRPYFES